MAVLKKPFGYFRNVIGEYQKNGTIYNHPGGYKNCSAISKTCTPTIKSIYQHHNAL